jgi:hypothetical protein
MKVFYGYDANGRLSSVETYSGGWPTCTCCEGCECLANPDCTNPNCVSLREIRTQLHPHIIGYIAYDCPCPADAETCDCVSPKFGSSYVLDGALVDKPACSTYVDGAEIAFEAEVYKTPGSSVALKFVGANVPDGTEVTCRTRGAQVYAETEFTLTFSGGETNTVQLTAPAQGVGAQITAYSMGPFVRPQLFTMVGFA